MNTPLTPRPGQAPHRPEEARGAVAATLLALADTLAEAFRVAAEACDDGLTPNEAVGSLLPLEGLIEEAAALHAAAVALHRRAR